MIPVELLDEKMDMISLKCLYSKVQELGSFRVQGKPYPHSKSAQLLRKSKDLLDGHDVESCIFSLWPSLDSQQKFRV